VEVLVLVFVTSILSKIIWHCSVSFFSRKKEKENIFLEDGIKKGMSWVGGQLKDYVGFDVLKSNTTHLKAIAEISVMADFSEDFHIKGDSQYASLFYNVDASTMQRHVAFDMNMMTIFVPNQDWEGKEKDHLQFMFCCKSTSRLIKITSFFGTGILLMIRIKPFTFS